MAPVACPAHERAPTSADGSAARILAAVAALTLGAVAYFTGIAVRRVSLFSYDVAGFVLELAEVPAEVAYLAEERDGIREEPSLVRAAEIMEGRLLTSRGVRGRFTVRLEQARRGAPRSWSARWCGSHESIALNDLATWAEGMGLVASRVGWAVIASLPAALPGAGPSLAKTKTAPRAASRVA
jgi:hypothetical protein